jgi:hypothetical protein
MGPTMCAKEWREGLEELEGHSREDLVRDETSEDRGTRGLRRGELERQPHIRHSGTTNGE